MGKLIINRLLDLLNNVQLIVLMATKKKTIQTILKKISTNEIQLFVISQPKALIAVSSLLVYLLILI